MGDEKQNQLSKVYNKIIEEKYGNEYLPNPLETFQMFKKRKQLASEHGDAEFTERVFEGILLFIALDGENEHTTSLMGKFFSLNSNPAFQDGSIESMTKAMGEQNIFGLIEEDYVRLLGIADFVYKNKDFDSAVRMYQALIFFFPGTLEPWLKWGNLTYENDFDYKKTLDIYQRCLELFDHPAVHASMGICHVKGKEFDLAEACFTKALELCEKFDDNELKEMSASMLNDLKQIKK